VSDLREAPHRVAGKAFPATRIPGRAWAPIGSALAAAAAVAAVAVVDPNEPGHYPACPFLLVTGQYCPGCGTLRAVHAMAHGDLGEALARNPLTVAAVPLVLLIWLAWARRAVTGRPRSWAAPGWAIWALGAAVVVFWVLRNLPGFEWLAP
jgi:hypothetical protein